MAKRAAKLDPQTMAALLDDVEWFFRDYRNQAEKAIVMSAFDVKRAESIDWAIDRITPRQRTTLHLITGGWGPAGKLRWTGYDHFQGFGPIVMGTEAAHYMAKKSGEGVAEYCKRIRDPKIVEELIECAKEYVQDAVLAFKQKRVAYLVRKR